MKLQLHANSLTIPSTELAGFFGSKTLAEEYRREARPVKSSGKCVLYDRHDAREWYERTYRAAKRPAK